ncbi:hypothetical protein KFE25_000722 [Diacronema lutheri]|uniref:RRM domain-containing protein n=1 Tax=Diacronema lutheri TaxID=2081491 RepID=A0A8J6CDT0_DIALT|nr:hypothetical protein KFE25_000722 [Diacronema lutheri]
MEREDEDVDAADLLSSDEEEEGEGDASEDDDGTPEDVHAAEQPAAPPQPAAVEHVPPADAAAEIASLRHQLAANGRLYDAHVRLIELLRGSGDVNGARHAREVMSAQFPLCERLWREWIADEKRQIAAAAGAAPGGVSAEAARAHGAYVLALYARGTADYLSPALWLERALFVLEGGGGGAAEDGEAAARAALEDAVAAAGAHVLEGGKLWAAYTLFERQLLDALRDDAAAEPTALAAQAARVRAVYRRRLCTPLLDLDGARREYAAWAASCGEVVDEEVLARADGAQRALGALLEHERALIDGGKEAESVCAAAAHTLSAQQWVRWQAYAAHEASRSAARACVVYERCVAAAPLFEPAWLEYVAYARAQRTVGARAASICERAARNIAVSAELWAAALLELDRFGMAAERGAAAFAAGCACGLRGGGPDYAALLCAYVAHLCRQLAVPPARPSDEQVAALRHAFALGEHYLGAAGVFPNADADDRFARLCARVEAMRLGDAAGARARWENILRRQGTRAAAWLEAIALVLETAEGGAVCAHAHARALFKRGVNSVQDAPALLSDAWVRFEEAHGSADELALALARAGRKAAEGAARAAAAASVGPWDMGARARSSVGAGARAGRAARAGADGGGRGGAGRGEARGESGDARRRTKRGLESGAADAGAEVRTEPSAKRAATATATAAGRGAAPARARARARGESGGGCDGGAPAAAAAAVARAESAPPAAESPPPPRRAHVKTLFFSNLEKSVDAPLVAAWTSNSHGAFRVDAPGAARPAVLDVRMVREKATGRFRGCAYVDVGAADGGEDSARACAEATSYALDLNGVFLRGQRVAVAISKPPAKRGAPEDPRTLYVSNLAAAVSADELRELFGAHGTLGADGVRLIPNKDGQPKGFAYIEYLLADAAAAARAQLDGALVHGRPLAIAQARQQPSSDAAGGEALGRGGGDVARAARAGRGGLRAFVPRGVARKPAVALPPRGGAAAPAAASAPAEEHVTRAPVGSNDAFRALFLAKRGA